MVSMSPHYLTESCAPVASDRSLRFGGDSQSLSPSHCVSGGSFAVGEWAGAPQFTPGPSLGAASSNRP